MSRRQALALGAVAGLPSQAATPVARVRGDEARKRQARYRPDSPEVQTFYRVNRYPTR